MRHRDSKDVHILIVDDQPDIAQLNALALYDFNCTVFTGHPVALLDPMTYAGYDVVLMDLMMPSVSGAEALTVVKESYGEDIIRMVFSGDHRQGGDLVVRGIAHAFLGQPASILRIASFVREQVRCREH